MVCIGTKPDRDQLEARARTLARLPTRGRVVPELRRLGVTPAEVADSSLRRDRETKQSIYAAAKVPVYWIVNLVDDVVEVYAEPTSRPKPHYKSRTDYSAGQKIPLSLDGKKVGSVNVEDFLL